LVSGLILQFQVLETPNDQRQSDLSTLEAEEAIAESRFWALGAGIASSAVHSSRLKANCVCACCSFGAVSSGCPAFSGRIVYSEPSRRVADCGEDTGAVTGTAGEVCACAPAGASTGQQMRAQLRDTSHRSAKGRASSTEPSWFVRHKPGGETNSNLGCSLRRVTEVAWVELSLGLQPTFNTGHHSKT
jgi:hypothetical protein